MGLRTAQFALMEFLWSAESMYRRVKTDILLLWPLHFSLTADVLPAQFHSKLVGLLNFSLSSEIFG